jgi:undecaprenyldiphospho-muramoylpentapeptide beta-N-acetylglucosaminyltransferase
VRVLFCGGGTGGHVYPALAVAKEVLEIRDWGLISNTQSPALRAGASDPISLYIGAEGEIEETLVPRAGLELETIPGGGLHGVGVWRLVRNALRLARGFVRAWRIVGRFEPDVLFLTGGYVSVPVACATWLRRKPIVVYLPDVEPGLAIKLLSRIATRVAVSVEDSRQYLPSDKVVVTGYPLRPEFHQVRRQDAREHFGVAPQDKVILVFGGSRGARTINRALGEILEPLLARARVLHVSGPLDVKECGARRDALPAEVQARYHLFDYMHDMAQALAAADLVVARAGASTLGEFPFFGLPAILVPYPYAWRYQKVNADYLVNQGAAIRLNDADMRQQLWPTIEALLNDAERLERMSANARKLARPDAAANLADLLAQLAHSS